MVESAASLLVFLLRQKRAREDGKGDCRCACAAKEMLCERQSAREDEQDGGGEFRSIARVDGRLKLLIFFVFFFLLLFTLTLSLSF